VQRVLLGSGITGLVIDYREPQTGVQWSSVSWTLPVLDKSGTRYERLDLITSVNYAGGAQAPDPQPSTGVASLMLTMLNGFGSDSASAAGVFRDANNALEGIAGSISASMLSKGSS